ncbi:amidohydrolase family protein [Sphingobium sp.]|uniref:amidohydrolase family protein n=1 Tax=Sphingobium sp. TaxID=1912891 RepID=UPI003BB72CFB
MASIPGARTSRGWPTRDLWCKYSGLRTEQAVGASSADLAPYATHLLDYFADRLMWGSDWPVVHLAGDDYADWHRTAAALAGVDGPAHDRLFAGAALEFYGVGPSHPGAIIPF